MKLHHRRDAVNRHFQYFQTCIPTFSCHFTGMTDELHARRSAGDEPVFNTFRRQPLRPFYSPVEFQIGVALLALLGGIAGWVAWQGAHPDPELFNGQSRPFEDQGQPTPVYKRPLWIEPESATPAATTGNTLPDPFPPSASGGDWLARGMPQMFDESNLYSKIDGRETFYKSYGFKRLHFLTLVSTGAPQPTIDMEVFELGSVKNALGALVAEMSNPDAVVTIKGQGLRYAGRNGGFVVKGQHYVRLIGSDDTPAISRKIVSLSDAFLAALPGEPLPWAYEFFVGGLQVSPSRLQYYAENAFSFGFANDVYVVSWPGGDTEVFLSQRPGADDAQLLAGKFAEGFAATGRRVPEGANGTALFKNEYIDAIDGVRAHGPYVIGVRLAKSADEARRRLDQIASQLDRRTEGNTP
ncbi:MAG: hypothetical protein HY343_00425 [Lentisphaerae bacterium]|nr:hypothetical protein [Lentisphaerota bacterium]